MAGFYKVVLNGSYQGKDNQCTLFYRTALDLAGGLFGFGGAAELAEEVLQEIVPEWLACKPEAYTLQTIDVEPRNGAFEALYQLPYKLDVNMIGTAGLGGQGLDTPALAMNFRFILEPTVIGLQTFTAPKRGYIAVGPCPSAWLGDDGRITDSFFTTPTSAINLLAEKLSQNLESVDPPAVWFPIRVAQHYGSVSGGLLGWGYADVMGVSIDRYATFRRSRRIKG